MNAAFIGTFFRKGFFSLASRWLGLRAILSRLKWVPGIMTVFSLGLLTGCGFSPWPDRPSSFTSELTVESLDFTESPRRFIVVSPKAGDSLSDPVRVTAKGIQTGYACTHITGINLEVDANLSGDGIAAFKSKIEGEIPELPDCSREKGRDTTFTFLFPSLASGIEIDLVNEAADTANTALVAHGQSHHDSLVYVKDSLNQVRSGIFTFRDTAGTEDAWLVSDSLEPCAYLNWVQGRRSQDTAWIRFETISLDAGSALDEFPCTETPHSDSLSVQWIEEAL